MRLDEPVICDGCGLEAPFSMATMRTIMETVVAGFGFVGHDDCVEALLLDERTWAEQGGPPVPGSVVTSDVADFAERAWQRAPEGYEAELARMRRDTALAPDPVEAILGHPGNCRPGEHEAAMIAQSESRAPLGGPAFIRWLGGPWVASDPPKVLTGIASVIGHPAVFLPPDTFVITSEH